MTGNLDRRAITAGLFLPLLYWTGGVVMISLFGYPGVVCMTPLAWLLALPVGLRVARESQSPPGRAVLEAGTGGVLLGLWQGLLFAAALVVAPRLSSAGIIAGIHSPLLSGLVAGLAGALVSGLLAALTARQALRVRDRTNLKQGDS